MVRSGFVLGGVVDVETTGLSPYRDEIIEICIVLFKYDLSSGRISGVLEEYVGLREPSCIIHPSASRVNGITMRDVQGQDLDYKRVTQMIEQASFLIAHNAPFDRGFITRLFPQAANKRWYCSMSGIDWRGKGFPNRRLQDLLYHHGINVYRAHRASDDVQATLELLSFCQQDGTTYIQELLLERRLKAQ